MILSWLVPFLLRFVVKAVAPELEASLAEKAHSIIHNLLSHSNQHSAPEVLLDQVQKAHELLGIKQTH